MKKMLLIALCACIYLYSYSEDGYRLWLRYDKISNTSLLQQYQQQISSISFPATSPTLIAAKEELLTGLSGLIQKHFTKSPPGNSLLVGTPASLPILNSFINKDELAKLSNEGFLIKTNKKSANIFIAANTDIGVLYGVFHFLRLIQTHQSLENLSFSSVVCRDLNTGDTAKITEKVGVSIYCKMTKNLLKY